MKQSEKRAMRLFRKLTQKSATLRPLDDKAYGLFIRGICKEKISAGFVKWLLHQDWVVMQNDCYVMSDAGQKWFRRQNSKDPFFEQNRSIRKKEIKTDNNDHRLLTVNEMESPLAWLRSRKDRNGNPLIDDMQFEAGERLRRDFTFAQMSGRVTADWSHIGTALKKRKHGDTGRDSSCISDSAIDAKNRYYAALDELGPELSGMVVDICCFLKGLEETEKILGLPKRSGKVVLQIGLSQLSRHYGLDNRITSQHIRKDPGEDCRPGL